MNIRLAIEPHDTCTVKFLNIRKKLALQNWALQETYIYFHFLRASMSVQWSKSYNRYCNIDHIML